MCLQLILTLQLDVHVIIFLSFFTAQLSHQLHLQKILQIINPLNPGQLTRRVYRLPGPIRDNVPVSVSVSVFWQRKFGQLLHYTYFHIYCSLTGTMYSSVSVSKSDFFDYITPPHCP